MHQCFEKSDNHVRFRPMLQLIKLDIKIQFRLLTSFSRVLLFFSQTVEYALRAVVHLADQVPLGQTTDQIADATSVPKAYLAKVLQSLVAGEIVNSRRGIGGGMTLARLPEELTILEVVNVVEPIQRIRECPLGRAEHGMNLCPIHRRLDEALAMVETAFGETTLADVLAEPNTSPPLCMPDSTRV